METLHNEIRHLKWALITLKRLGSFLKVGGLRNESSTNVVIKDIYI